MPRTSHRDNEDRDFRANGASARTPRGRPTATTMKLSPTSTPELHVNRPRFGRGYGKQNVASDGLRASIGRCGSPPRPGPQRVAYVAHDVVAA